MFDATEGSADAWISGWTIWKCCESEIRRALECGVVCGRKRRQFCVGGGGVYVYVHGRERWEGVGWSEGGFRDEGIQDDKGAVRMDCQPIQ